MVYYCFNHISSFFRYFSICGIPWLATGKWFPADWRIKKPTFDELWMSGNDQAEKL